ncbi:hypothetical protein [Nocardia asiatica]
MTEAIELLVRTLTGDDSVNPIVFTRLSSMSSAHHWASAYSSKFSED